MAPFRLCCVPIGASGFPITALREVNTLLKCKHENIVSVQEIVVGSNMDLIYIVMEFIEHDLKSLLETMKQPFAPSEVRPCVLWQRRRDCVRGP